MAMVGHAVRACRRFYDNCRPIPSIGDFTIFDIAVFEFYPQFESMMIKRECPGRSRRRLPQTAIYLASLTMACMGVLATASAWADTFVLKSGGQLEGTWLNRDDSPRKTYEIETASGGQVTLAANTVAKVIKPSSTQIEYETLRPSHADTVAGHEALAAWCLDHKLRNERKRHLRRILELDADHQAARAALGYRQVNGRWMTHEEEMAHRGLHMYDGRYRTAQEIEILKAKQGQKKAEKQWFRELNKWSIWLDQDLRFEQAEKRIREIHDPAAVPALSMAISKEERTSVCLLFIEALAGIGTRSAIDVLVGLSIDDEDEEIRETAVEYVVQSGHDDVVKTYTRLLKHKENFRINRAAFALGELKNSEAIEPLIDALVTTHRRLIDRGTNPGQVSASFSPDGSGGGLSSGGGGPKYEKRRLRNPAVLSALVALTDGANHAYDQIAWRRWNTQNRRSTDVDARRD